jgi:serine/threonine protein kinase
MWRARARQRVFRAKLEGAEAARAQSGRQRRATKAAGGATLYTVGDPLPSPTDDLIGSDLPGGYALLEVIGRGGVGTVYRARRPEGSFVAVKRLHPHLVGQRSIVGRFRREAALLARVLDPGVVPILEVGEDGAIPFLVTPLLEGETLEERRVAHNGTLKQSEVVACGLDLLRILEAAHRVGVVHRDVKPANVFREKNGTIRLLDFGLGGFMSEEEDDAGMSGVEELLGTVSFMSPEQAAGRLGDVDARTDVYAMGALLFKLATGLDVHEGSTSRERLMNAATRPAPRCEPRAPMLNPAFAAVLDRALSYSPGQRFQRAEDMRQALLGLSVTQLRPSLADFQPEPQARRVQMWLWFAPLLPLSIGLGTWYATHRPDPISTEPVNPQRNALPSNRTDSTPLANPTALSAPTALPNPALSAPTALAPTATSAPTGAKVRPVPTAKVVTTSTARGPQTPDPKNTGDPWDKRR